MESVLVETELRTILKNVITIRSMIFDIAPINVNLQLKESHIVLEAQFAELDTVEMESLSLISMNHVTMPTI